MRVSQKFRYRQTIEALEKKLEYANEKIARLRERMLSMARDKAAAK